MRLLVDESAGWPQEGIAPILLDAMQTRARDVFWAAVAVAVVVIFVILLVRMLLSVSPSPGVAEIAAVLLGTLLNGVFAWWLGWGAWRRTKWGAPPGGAREQAEDRARGAARSDQVTG